MNKSSAWYSRVSNALERSWLFNLYQIVADPGKRRQIDKFLHDVPYVSVVDIGCGTGNWASVARGRYLGLDTSASFIAASRQRYHHDPTKKFLHANAGSLVLPERYDLAILISVLHHLSDDEATRLVNWVARSARYFFVLDLYPVPWNPISRWLYAMDRGNYVREPSIQKQLILREPSLKLVKEGDYYCPNGLYRHTLFLFARAAHSWWLFTFEWDAENLLFGLCQFL